MNGIRFYRQKNRLAICELSQLAQVSAPVIRSLEKKIQPNTALSIYLRLTDALGITLDELLDDYDPALLKDGDRHAHARTKSKPARNPIAVYRRDENLSLQQLADRLGVTSREWARRVCDSKSVRPQHLQLLAAYEGVTEDEFLLRYAVSEGASA